MTKRAVRDDYRYISPLTTLKWSYKVCSCQIKEDQGPKFPNRHSEKPPKTESEVIKWGRTHSVLPDTARITGNSFGGDSWGLRASEICRSRDCVETTQFGAWISLSKSGPKVTATIGYFRQKYIPWVDFLYSTDLNCSGFPLRLPVARQQKELMTLRCDDLCFWHCRKTISKFPGKELYFFEF